MSFLINPYMFGPRKQFWTDFSSTAGKVITGFSSAFTNALTVDWGDGTTTPLTSTVSVNKTLGTTNTIDFEIGNANVTRINCGTSSPRLGGTVDISAFPNLTQFICNSNDITAMSGYAGGTKLRLIQFFDNKITGTIPNLDQMVELRRFESYQNQLTGSVPSLSTLPLLQNFNSSQNQLTGSIPSLSTLVDLRDFSLHTNQLTGSIPSLSGLTLLQNFAVHTNQLTGTIPSLAGLTSLERFECGNNQLTGSIPLLSGLTNLRDISFASNQLTNFAGGSVSNTLGEFRAQNNLLTSTAVNAILAAFVAAGRTSASGICVLNLSGAGNAAATGQGLTDRATLQSRGWGVTP